MATISFKATVFKPEAAENLGSEPLLRLPKAASAKLPSRGMTLVKGTMNNFSFQVVVEPDGQGSHWFRVGKALRTGAKADVGDTVTLDVKPSKDWPEPKVPDHLKKALRDDPKARTIWKEITPMARWDWIRWIGAAKQEKTREHRIEVACSKLRSGMRRACCFNRTECTLTEA
jgi:hypothetical protein